MSAMRAPTDEDGAAVARIASEHWPEPVDEGTIERWWSAPGVDRDRDARLEPAAYAQVDAMDGERVWIHLRGDPSPALLDWAESRALERGGRVLSGAWAANERVLAELERRGFRSIRSSYRMSIDLDTDLPAAVWPGGVRPRTFRDGDARAFYDSANDAFADTWEPIVPSFDEWSHATLDSPGFDPNLWLLAEGPQDVAGFAICNVHAVDRGLGWVQMLGVRQPWRGRGVGRALLLTALAAFHDRGLARARLGVDAENPTGATQLYESIGMHVADRFEMVELERA